MKVKMKTKQRRMTIKKKYTIKNLSEMEFNVLTKILDNTTWDDDKVVATALGLDEDKVKDVTDKLYEVLSKECTA